MADRPKKKPGPPKGVRIGGRSKGTKNRVTTEREAKARLELKEQIRREQAGAADRLADAGVETLDGAKALAAGQPEKLMKDIAFDFARMFAGLAAFYQPYPRWTHDPATGAMKNGNPNFNEAKFKEYAVLAKDTAIAAASYQSPKLSAVMIGADIINRIEVEGGLPDDLDGGLVDAPSAGEPAYLGKSQLGVAGDDAGGGVSGRQGDAADVSSGAGPAVPDEGQVQGGPVRKAVG